MRAPFVRRSTADALAVVANRQTERVDQAYRNAVAQDEYVEQLRAERDAALREVNELTQEVDRLREQARIDRTSTSVAF